MCFFGDMQADTDRQTDRQTYRHADCTTSHPMGQSLIMIVLGKEKAQSNKDKQHLQQHVKRSTKKTVRLD